MSSSSSIFTGSSSFSTDLQNVVSRAVAIASLPINRLTVDKTTLSKQADELATLDGKVAAVQDALKGISTALNSSFDSSVSDTAVLGATVGEGAAEGAYSVLVSDAGAYSTMMTGSWVADTGAAKTFKLSIGAAEYDITPADNSASSVASAINRAHGDKVHATVVNVGGASNPDYRISLQSVDLTADLIDLKDDQAVSLQQVQTAGRVAKYEVNGSGVTVESASRSASIADGVSFTILKSSATAVDLTITRSTSALNDALKGFVTAYNNVVAAVDGQRGSSDGALNGNTILADIASALGKVSTYSGSGTFTGLRDLGLELQKDGTLQQNQFSLIAADLKNSAGVTSFFTAFTEAAGEAIDGLEDTTNGLIKIAASGMQSQIDTLTDSINTKQQQVDDLEFRLNNQMASADALLSSLEQKYSYMSGLFSAMDTASKQNQ